jgi:hypothetical protein
MLLDIVLYDWKKFVIIEITVFGFLCIIINGIYNGISKLFKNKKK